QAGARAAAERATTFAKAAPGKHDRALAPVEPVEGEYQTPREQDPIDVPLGDKIALCFGAEEAMQNVDIKVTTAFVRAMRERKVHESTGHPTELDRVYGTEAAYAGTSFIRPGDLGSLRYGSEWMNITADPTTPGGIGTFGYDDEGVPAERTPIVEAGILRGFLTSRETAAKIGSGRGGSMRADGWSRMPLVRMTNLHLEPGEGTLED